MKRVLVIDDDDEIRHLISSYLKLRRYDVTDISSGVRAAKEMARQPFDLIVCDIFMPDKNGIETVVEIREIHSSVPIIVITGGCLHFPVGGDGLRDLLQSVEFFGGTHFLMKPFRPSQLVSLVERVLGQH